MISFKGVTPSPSPAAPPPAPEQPKRMSEQEPVPTAAPKLRNQPEQDTVQFSSK